MRFRAVLVTTLGLAGACLSTPARPRDDAPGPSIDAAVDAAPAGPPMFVSRNSGLAAGTSGTLAVLPPSDAMAGDVVLLYLDRYWADTPLAEMNGWHSIAFLTFDADAPQIFYRTAASDEVNQTSAYTFAAGTLGTPPDAGWVVDVWHNASSVERAFATFDATLTTMPTFPAVNAKPNEIVIDVSVAPTDYVCSAPAGVDHRILWAFYTHAPGNAPQITFTCDDSQPYARFQLRVLP